jgi:hypothetical protein
MAAKNTCGTVLIRENTLLPVGLTLETQAFLPGWRTVQNIDAFQLTRKIEEAGWNFFYLAGETKATALGRERPGTLRRATKQILAKRKWQKFNSLEITNVTLKSFLGIPFLDVAANSRHIGESLHLVPGGVAPVSKPAAVAQRIGLQGQERQSAAVVLTNDHPGEVSSV